MLHNDEDIVIKMSIKKYLMDIMDIMDCHKNE